MFIIAGTLLLSIGKHEFMGEVRTSVRELTVRGAEGLDVIEPAKQSKKGYVNSGKLRCTNIAIEHYPTLTEVHFTYKHDELLGRS